ncbi:MAG TPA: zinc-binding dehydrogenase [Acidimicrobiales bacterium]|nr:zinc-binding dehydrogenase [Acidimicrobiales bacterium]
MKALLVERSLPRFAAARLVSSVGGSGTSAGIGPLRLTDVEAPALPGPGWQRVRPVLAGICGSDLATLDGRSSRYFEDIVSFPFVPGHEVVGVVEDAATGPAGAPVPGTLAPGTRVVVEPVLGCIPRGIEPPCEACADGRVGGCERVAFGHLAPGLQIGFCADTGGGWSQAGLVAHAVQLHPVPEALSDDDAVMIEPTACAVHAALAAQVEPGDMVAVLGGGTVGLTTTAALRQLATPGALLVGARYGHQRDLAGELGADLAVSPEQLTRAVRRRSRSFESSGHLSGGADIVVDCVGSADSLSQCLAMVRPRGRVVVVGMPAKTTLDLASLWHREVSMVGAYAYGSERTGTARRRTFAIAMEVVAAARLGRLVSARYPLERFEEAVAHAGSAGRRGAVKIVFEMHHRSPKGSAS